MFANFSRVGRRVVPSLLAVLLGSLAGCTASSPLPKHAALQAASGSMPATDFASVVSSADIVYFPSERAASGARSEPAGLLLEALQKSGAPFAIAWDLVDAKEQPLLDQLGSQEPAARENLVAGLELAGAGRAREHCRSVLNDPRVAAVRQIALKMPEADMQRVVQAQPQSAMHFRLPPAGLETFAERMSAAECLSGRDVAAAYRIHVAAQQFAAEQIVHHFETGGAGKLLVFIHAADLESGQGVPFYVAQKLSLRQLVLGTETGRAGSTRLLTGRLPVDDRRFEIVDGAPASAGD